MVKLMMGWHTFGGVKMRATWKVDWTSEQASSAASGGTAYGKFKLNCMKVNLGVMEVFYA
jgi:hypothetical protein